MTRRDLDILAGAYGKAMAEKGYPGFTLDVYVPAPEDMGPDSRPYEVLTRGGLIRYHFHG